MANNSRKKVLWIDFFGVICSEIAPFWFQKYFPNDLPDSLLKKYFLPADVGEISNKELMKGLSTLIGKSTEDVEKEFYSMVHIQKDVVAYIEKLKKSHHVILCSNASADFPRKIIRDNHLDYLFDDIIISSEIGYRKPDVKFFEKCLLVSQCKKEEVIFIDDNTRNIEAAKNFGVHAILFTGSCDLPQNI
jgi:HAD superfamily hydrolase (TIGR01509 family)